MGIVAILDQLIKLNQQKYHNDEQNGLKLPQIIFYDVKSWPKEKKWIGTILLSGTQIYYNPIFVFKFKSMKFLFLSDKW